MTSTKSSLAEVEETIIATIRKCVPHPEGTINPTTAPIDDLDEFDSLCAIEVLVELSEQLGLELEDDLFLKAKPRSRKHMTISEVSQIVYDKLGRTAEGESNG